MTIRRDRWSFPEQRSNLAHGYAGRADEDMRVELPPVGGQGRVKGFPRRMDDVRRACGTRGVDYRGQPSPAAISLARTTPLSVKAYRAQRPSKASLQGDFCNHVKSQRHKAVMRRLGIQRPAHENEPLPPETRLFDLACDVGHRAPRMRSSGHVAR